MKKSYFFMNKNKPNITILALMMVVVFGFFTSSCRGDTKDVVEVAFDPETTYTLKVTDMSNLVSDSGIIRYRLDAKEWLVYDKAKVPYWHFPEGLYVEKFDTLFNIDVSIKADTAYYYTKKELWKLVDNVKVKNAEGQRFETDLLYWDQKQEKVYSDKNIRIEKEDKIIIGVGFESNQTMTKYKVFNTQGEFPIENKPVVDSTSVTSETTLQVVDSVQPSNVK